MAFGGNPFGAIPGSVTGNLPWGCNSPNNNFAALMSEVDELEYGLLIEIRQEMGMR